MNIDHFTLEPFSPYVSSHRAIKIKGFSFLIVNPLALGQTNIHGTVINYDYFNTGVFGLTRRLSVQTIEDYFLGYFDINSTNEEYLKEVQKLKNTFNVKPDSQFKCRKYCFLDYLNYDYIPFEVFMFEFDDIFQSYTEFSKGFNITNLDAGRGFYYPFDNVPMYSLDSTHRIFNEYRGLYRQFRLQENALIPDIDIGIPVLINQYDLVYGVSFGFELFLKNDIYYLFRLSKIPRLNSSKDTAIVIFDLYEIPIKKSCCLAECFGITN